MYLQRIIIYWNNLSVVYYFSDILLKEQVAMLGVGRIPRSMWVTLEDDLVGSCKPGDDVVIR